MTPGSYSRRETTVHETPLLESHPPLVRFVGAICIQAFYETSSQLLADLGQVRAKKL